jgi:hypothetical protein
VLQSFSCLEGLKRDYFSCFQKNFQQKPFDNERLPSFWQFFLREALLQLKKYLPLLSRRERVFIEKNIFAGIAQLVEHNLAKVGVASSSLVSRSRAQVVKSVDTQDLKSCVR